MLRVYFDKSTKTRQYCFIVKRNLPFAKQKTLGSNLQHCEILFANIQTDVLYHVFIPVEAPGYNSSMLDMICLNIAIGEIPIKFLYINQISTFKVDSDAGISMHNLQMQHQNWLQIWKYLFCVYLLNYILKRVVLSSPRTPLMLCLPYQVIGGFHLECI